MNFKKSMSVLIAVAFSASVAACGTESTMTQLPAGTDVNASAAASKYSKLANGAVIEGEMIVKLKPNAKASNAFKNGESVTALGGNDTGLLLVKSDSPMTNMSSNSNILWSEPNRVIKLPKETTKSADSVKDGVTAVASPLDALFAKQWAHKNSNSVEGWALAAKSGKNANVTIAIVDTGIDAKHPDLKAKILPGFDAYGKNQEGEDAQGHGTHCAGIAGAIHNDIGVAGYSVNSNLISVKVLGNDGSGTYAAVAAGILWAAKSKADIISMSLGGPSTSKALDDAVALAVKNDKLVAVAMGNDGNSSVSYPAGTVGSFSVGATDSADKIARFSQFGKHCAISAPGVDIMSTFPTYQSGMPAINYGSISGTSMATPGVAGLAALVKSVNPSLKAKDIQEILKKSADDLGDKGWDQYFGAGRINTLNAVKLALGQKIK
ncbi:MAG: hypothetical protein EOO89_25880 [Pedobacter sp.]|nr:MAG: hypothetical protein EOO89_25880 [Pedobacter sp.]